MTQITRGVLDVYRKQHDYPSLRAAVVGQGQQYRPGSILIEDTGNGTALLQEYHHHQLPGVPYPTPIRPKGDKVVRMSAQSAKIEAGHVHLPGNAPWLDEFRKELLTFPNGQHDDQVDSFSQFLNWYDNRPQCWVVKLLGV